jgi:very-short-patch-repair endonuclease
MANADSVLVAIMNNRVDFEIARDNHWYRIPVEKAEKWGKHHWPPKWLAFYQTRAFGDEAHLIKYYAHVHDILKVKRCELFPDQPGDQKADHLYYQLILSPLLEKRPPIPSLRFRRVVFIPTTWQKFWTALEINDLWDESPLEDALWLELKRLQLTPERQEFVTLNMRRYAFDFAFHCARGKLNVETDGDLWHSHPARIAEDNRRDNALARAGWRLLRFNTSQIREQMADYCLPLIREMVDDLGGPGE